jgi:hypothetical protein
MLKQLLTVTVLAAGTALPLLSAGCASGGNNGEYGLTGSNSNADRAAQMSPQERQRYTDQKGHFHTEWIGQGFHDWMT